MAELRRCGFRLAREILWWVRSIGYTPAAQCRVRRTHDDLAGNDRSNMTAVLITPPYTDDARRQAMYQGDLEVAAPTERTRAFCEFAREMIEEAFQPLDPESRPRRHGGRGLRGDACGVEAAIHPRSPVQGIHPGHPRGARQRPRPDVLRRAASALLDEWWVPHDGNRLRLAPAPRHLVLGSNAADQPLDARVPHRGGERPGLSRSVLRDGASQFLCVLQLLRVEFEAPGHCFEEHQDGFPAAARRDRRSSTSATRWCSFPTSAA